MNERARELSEQETCRNCGVEIGESHLPHCAEGVGPFRGYDDGDVSVTVGSDPTREYVDQDGGEDEMHSDIARPTEGGPTQFFTDDDGVDHRRPTIAELEKKIVAGEPVGRLRPDGTFEDPDPRLLLRAMREETPLHELVAQVCHEVNRAYSRSVGEEFGHSPWSETPKDVRDSAIAGVATLFDSPSTTPERMHQLWMERKIAEGWQWGPTKNYDTRRHPCLLSYDRLSAEQRAKDRLFRAVCLAFLGVEE